MAEKVIKEFSNEEKESISTLQGKVLSVTSRLGEIEIEVAGLEARFSDLKTEKQTLMDSYKELRVEENELASELRKKYGEGTYDISSQTFTPNQ